MSRFATVRRIFLVACVGLAGSPAATLETADEIRSCIESNRPALSSSQKVVFTAVDRTGAETESVARLYWQDKDGRLQSLVRFSAPADLRGSALLLLQKKDRADMFMYLPELGKVRRVNRHAAHGSMFGTDLTYEDFERLQGMASDRSLERLEDTEVAGRAVYVVQGTPAREEESAYVRVVFYVDRKTCVALKTELFQNGDRLRKVLLVSPDDVGSHPSAERTIHLPGRLEVRDLIDETRTVVRLEDLEVDKKLPRKLFSERELTRGGR